MKISNLKNKRLSILTSFFIAILGGCCFFLHPAMSATTPEINGEKIKLNSRSIDDNSASITNLEKTIGPRINQLIIILVSAAIVSRTVDYILSRTSKDQTVKELKWDFEKDILPEIVRQEIKSNMTELQTKNSLIEREIFFMQYELIDLSLSQFELEKKLNTENSTAQLNPDTEAKNLIRSVEYNVRAIKLLQRIKANLNQLLQGSDLASQIDKRIIISLRQIAILLVKIPDKEVLNLSHLRGELKNMIMAKGSDHQSSENANQDSIHEASYQYHVDQAIKLIETKMNHQPVIS